MRRLLSLSLALAFALVLGTASAQSVVTVPSATIAATAGSLPVTVTLTDADGAGSLQIQVVSCNYTPCHVVSSVIVHGPSAVQTVTLPLPPMLKGGTYTIQAAYRDGRVVTTGESTLTVQPLRPG